MAWSPNSYLKFGAARLRPAIDLINQSVASIGDPSKVKRVLDLGCGPGNVTELLCKSFPSAVVEGVDSSIEMIDKATKVNKDSLFKNRIQFRVGTVETEAERAVIDKYDVVYSNAALHWCLDHQTLFPKIIKNMINPKGGVFAVQMPDTREQDSHVLMEIAALRCGFLDDVRAIRIPRVEEDPSWYFKLLNQHCSDVDMWTTDYIQQLPTSCMPTVDNKHMSGSSRHPVLEYTKSTGLMPILQALGGDSDDRCKKYLREYERLLIDKYPTTLLPGKTVGEPGKLVTLMPFKRFFFVCTL